jgi:hypothetical protein
VHFCRPAAFGGRLALRSMAQHRLGRTYAALGFISLIRGQSQSVFRRHVPLCAARHSPRAGHSSGACWRLTRRRSRVGYEGGQRKVASLTESHLGGAGLEASVLQGYSLSILTRQEAGQDLRDSSLCDRELRQARPALPSVPIERTNA